MPLGAQIQTLPLPFRESRRPADPASVSCLAPGPTTTYLPLPPAQVLTTAHLRAPEPAHPSWHLPGVSASTPNYPTAARLIYLKAQPNFTLPHRRATLSPGLAN